MKRPSISLLALVLVACGSPSSAPPSSTVAPASDVPPSTVVAPVATTASAPPSIVTPPVAETAALAAPATENGLPSVTVGPAIHLANLPITTRDVDGHHVPSVTVADPTARANLDRWFEANVEQCRGRPELAIDGFVSYTCHFYEHTLDNFDLQGMNLIITATGDVVPAHPADAFLPGTDLLAMVDVWIDQHAPFNNEISFEPAGALMQPLNDDGEELAIHIPWRIVAPYIRADGPLGPALLAAGLTLAPPGTQAVLPARANAIDCGDGVSAMLRAAALPADIRARTRARTFPDGVSLLLPVDAPNVTDARPSYLYGVLADLVPVRLTGPVQIREDAGPRAAVTGALPAGTAAIALRGPIGTRVSELGTGWTLVATPSAAGYVQGRNVALNDGCGAPTSADDATGGYVDLAPDAHFAWTLTAAEGAQRDVTIFPVDAECTIGAQARHARVAGDVTELRLARAAADGDTWLLVVISAVDLAATTRTISVFGPDSDAPLYTNATDAPVLHLAERRGPDHAAGYYAITIASGTTHTWLSWNGHGLDAVTQ